MHYLPETLALSGTRDSYLTIKNYQGQKVKVSGGMPLNLTWEMQGSIQTGHYQGSCGEMYFGEYRMMKARSPNIGSYAENTHYVTEPYHKVAGFLVETDDCKMETNWFSQKNCPAENKNGFYLNDEMSPDWSDLDQTQILFFHSWINEYARVASVTNENGRNKVLFQEPLNHAAVGVWIKSGALRYLVVNNRAVLDMPGEYVCTEKDGMATVSFIPPEGYDSSTIPVMSMVDKIITITNSANIAVQGLDIVHTNYIGLDRNMDWQHAAIVVKQSQGK